LESLGEYLKLERESRNISLEEISQTTRISIKMLTAIENDDKDSLPGTAFTRGFIKAYAKYVGLDETDALHRFDHFYEKEEDIEGFKREEVVDFFPEKDRKPLLYVVLAILLLWFVYTIASFGDKDKEDAAKPAKKDETKMVIDKEPSVKVTAAKPEEEEEAPEVETAIPSATEKPEKLKKPEEPKKVPAAQPAKETAEKPKPRPFIVGEKHKLVFRSDGIVWMLIQVDDDEPYEVTMHADEVYKVTAYDTLKVKIGDAGKVRLEFDGEDLGYLGAEKQVRNITLPLKEEE
jgi:cytoskeleton protein RodZ